MTSSRLAAFLDLRTGEGRVVGLLAVHSFFLGLSTSLFETVGETLFLTHYGADRIAWVYMAWAIAVPLAGLAYGWLQNWLGVARTWVATVVFAAVLSAGMALGFQFGSGKGPSFAMLVARDVLWTLMWMEFWDLTGSLLDLQQAKRLFGLVGGGEVAGGIGAGLLVAPLLRALAVPGVIWIAAAGYLVCLAMLLVLLRERRPADDTDDPATPPASWRAMLKERYIVLVLMVPVVYTVAYDFLEYAFFSQAEARYGQNQVALAGFLGLALVVGQVLTLLVRTLISGPVLARFGLWVALATLPAILCLGASGLLALSLTAGATAPLFWPVVALKLGDVVVREALDRPSFLVLFQVLARNLRVRVHAVQESISEPVTSCLSGAILLGSTFLLAGQPLSMKIAGAAALIAVAAAAWLALVARIRPAYDGMLARALSRRTLAVPQSEPFAWESSVAPFLRARLASQNPGEVIYCLSLLAPTLERGELASYLQILLRHQERAVRLEACRRVEEARLAFLRWTLEESLVGERDPEVAGATLRALAAVTESDAIDAIAPYVTDARPAVRKGALVGLVKYGGIPGVLTAGERLLKLLDAPAAADRIFAADVLGEVAIRDYYQPLLRLLDDPDLSVRRAALAAAATVQSPRMWARLLDCLADPELESRARQALAAGGVEAVPVLETALAAARARSVAASIAQILGRIGGPAATRVLVAQLDHPMPEVRYEVFRALDGRGQLANGPHSAALPQLEREVRHAAAIHDALADLRSCAEAAELVAALARQNDRQLEMVLALLQLLHPGGDLSLARHHLGSPSPTKRAYAIEIIDRTCAHQVTRLVLPLVEDLSEAERRSHLERLAAVELLGLVPRLRQIIAGAVPWTTGWMRACAVYTAERLGETALAPDVRACLDDPDPLVRETALWATSRLEEPTLGTDLRERVTRALGDPDRGVRRIAALLAADSRRFPP